MTAPIYVSSSGGDDAPAINAAFAANKSVVLGAENYQVASTIMVPPNGNLVGQCRGTNITKIANCDMLDLAYGASISDFVMNGDGTNFTGRGVVVREGQHYQRITNVSINSHGYCIDMSAPQAGGHITVDDCFITRYPNLQTYSIKLPDNDGSGGNRIFRNIRASGGYGIDLAGAGNTVVDRCNMAQIRMDPTCRTLLLQNCRLGGPVDFHGRQFWVAFNNVANGIWVHGDVYDSLFIATHSNNPINRTDPASNNNKVW